MDITFGIMMVCLQSMREMLLNQPTTYYVESDTHFSVPTFRISYDSAYHTIYTQAAKDGAWREGPRPIHVHFMSISFFPDCARIIKNGVYTQGPVEVQYCDPNFFENLPRAAYHLLPDKYKNPEHK